ncbi:MAG: 16S rRNA (guanine527-N7)-methyltransferase [Pelagibacterales bacterium]|nr:16S rRNA (guanine527-N7)-methyltransferase [Pelagibacterales bacterium]
MDRDLQIDILCRKYLVSRETITSLKEYEKTLIKGNISLNLIGKSTIEQIWNRHILDSFQVIDFIDKNDKTLIDVGSGAGLPGIILAIAAKNKKIPLKIHLIDKSKKKTNFLKETVKNLNLNINVICQNIFENEEEIVSDVFIARAFKPLPTILELIHNKEIKYKKFFVFLGKTGKKELLLASKIWDIQYKQHMSVTNSDSFIIEINNLKKK